MEIRDNTFGGNGARVNQGHRQRPQQPGYRPALGRLDSSKVGGGSGRDMASAMTWSSVAGAMDSNPNTNSNSNIKTNTITRLMLQIMVIYKNKTSAKY